MKPGDIVWLCDSPDGRTLCNNGNCQEFPCSGAIKVAILSIEENK